MTTINDLKAAIAQNTTAQTEAFRKGCLLGGKAKATILALEEAHKAFSALEAAEAAYSSTKEGRETIEAMRRLGWEYEYPSELVNFHEWLQGEGGFKKAALEAGWTEEEASIPLNVRYLNAQEKLDRVKARFEYANTGADYDRPGAIWFHVDPVRTLHWQETEEEYQAKKAWYKTELEALGLRADNTGVEGDTGWEISLHGGHTLTLF